MSLREWDARAPLAARLTERVGTGVLGRPFIESALGPLGWSSSSSMGPPRPALAQRWGTVLSIAVACVLLAVALGEVGPVYHLDESHRSNLTLSFSNPKNLCGASDCGYPYPNDVESIYIPGGHLWVVSMSESGGGLGGDGGSGLFEFSEDGEGTLSSMSLACSPYDPYYPGFGTDVFIECGSFYPASVSILVFNWSSARIIASIPLNSTSNCLRGMSFNLGEDVLYCPGGSDAGRTGDFFVRTISLESEAVVANTSLAGIAPYPAPSWFNPTANSLICTLSEPGNSIGSLDPSTGSVSRHTSLSGRVLALASDSQTGALWALSADDGQPTANLTVLNGTSLAIDRVLQIPYATGPLTFGTDYKDLYVGTGNTGFVVVSAASGNVVRFDLATTQPSVIPYADSFINTAFDPNDGAMGGGINFYGGPVGFTVASVSYANSSGAPYSTVTLFGPALPYFVAGAGVFLGVAASVLFALSRSRTRLEVPDG